MTSTGIKRMKYSAQVEQAPSRFTESGAYKEWAQRADAWNGENK